MEKNFHHQNVLITGGSSGLGRALALNFASRGARVGVVARGTEALAELHREHPEILTFTADIGSKEAIHPLAGQVHSRLGEVDILIHAASSLGPTPLRLLADTDCEDFEVVLQTNLLGPFRLTKALLAPMILRRRGIVVNISSDAAVSAYPRWGAYAVSKAALDHLTRVFQVELEAEGLHFLAVDPGDMRTPLHFAAIPEADPARLRDPADSAAALIELLARGDFSQIRRSL